MAVFSLTPGLFLRWFRVPVLARVSVSSALNLFYVGNNFSVSYLDFAYSVFPPIRKLGFFSKVQSDL